MSGWAGSRIQTGLSSPDSLDQLAPGTAGIVNDREGRWASYRDKDGIIQAVSAACTHMGCLVEFSQVEMEWQCPCHGSRFVLDGTVIQGPATEPLKPRHQGLAS